MGSRPPFGTPLSVSPLEHGRSQSASLAAQASSPCIQPVASQTWMERGTSDPHGSTLRHPRFDLTHRRGHRCAPHVGAHDDARSVDRRTAVPDGGPGLIRIANHSSCARSTFQPMRKPLSVTECHSFSSLHARRFACRRQGDDEHPMVWVISFPPNVWTQFPRRTGRFLPLARLKFSQPLHRTR